MSSRLHNKFHRHNHHTNSQGDARYPDASYDPIASYDSPFQGDFVLNGNLSISTTFTTTSALSGFNTSSVLPIYTNTGTLIGYIPIISLP